jgi:hypothetical protein
MWNEAPREESTHATFDGDRDLRSDHARECGIRRPDSKRTAKACCTAPAPPTSPPLDAVAWCHLTILGIAGLIAWVVKTGAELYAKHEIEKLHLSREIAKIVAESKSPKKEIDQVKEAIDELKAAVAKYPAGIDTLSAKLTNLSEMIERMRQTL